MKLISMLQRWILLFIIVFFANVCSFNAQMFEGKISYNFTDKNESSSFSFDVYFKNGKIRLDGVFPEFEDQKDIKISGIFMNDKSYLIMDEAKMCLILPNNGFMESFGSKLDIREDLNDKTESLTKLFSAKNIAGYECEGWTIKDSCSIVTIWATDKIGAKNFFLGLLENDKDSFEKLGNLDLNKYLVMEIEINNPAAEHIILTVKSIDKIVVPDSYFLIPENYQIMDLTALGSYEDD